MIEFVSCYLLLLTLFSVPFWPALLILHALGD